jgi:hypothetical protein
MLNIIMLSVIMLNVIMLNVIILNVIMLSVMAPYDKPNLKIMTPSVIGHSTTNSV